MHVRVGVHGHTKMLHLCYHINVLFTGTTP